MESEIITEIREDSIGNNEHDDTNQEQTKDVNYAWKKSGVECKYKG